MRVIKILSPAATPRSTYRKFAARRRVRRNVVLTERVRGG